MRALAFLAVALATAAALPAQDADPLIERAAVLLRDSEHAGRVRQLAADIVVADPDRAAALADELAEGDWKQGLSALAIWSRLGPDRVLREAVARRGWDRSTNLALRVRCLEALVGLDDASAASGLLAALDDPVWLVRRAALASVGSLPPEVLERCGDRLLARLDDPIEELRARARDLCLEIAGRSPAMLDALVERPWRDWRDRRARRHLVWALLDARARGQAPPPAELQLDRGDPFSRALALAFMEPGPDRIQAWVALARDPSARELLGDALLAAVKEIVAAEEPDMPESLWRDGPIGDGVLGEIVARLAPTAGRRLRMLVLDDLVAELDRERIEEIVLREAFENPPTDLADLLDRLFEEIGPRGASRRRLRRIMKLRSSLDVPIADELLLRGLEEGPFPRRVIVAEQIWRRSDARMRGLLLDHLRHRLDANDRARAPILRILVERPREDALDLYAATVVDPWQAEDLRIKALDVLLALDPEHRLTAAEIEAAPTELRLRMIEHETGPGRVGRKIVALAIADRGLADLPLEELRLASLCDFEELDLQVEEAIRAGSFDGRRLPVYLDYVRRRRGPERARAVVGELLDRGLDLEASVRSLTAYARMDGKVIENLIDAYQPDRPLSRLFDLVGLDAIDEPDRVLYAVARLARRRGEGAELMRLLEQRWRALVADAEGRGGAELDAIARELLLCRDDRLRRLVVARAEAAVDACCGRDLERERAFAAAVLLESSFQALVESAEEGALASAVDLLGRCGRRLAELHLAGGEVAGREGYDPRLSMISVLTAETREGLAAETTGLAAVALGRLRDDPDFWLAWARQSLRFPEPGPFGRLLAERLLAMPPIQLRGHDHILVALGARLMAGEAAEPGARLLRRGRRLAGAAAARDDQDERFERIVLSSGVDAQVAYWLDHEAELLTSGDAEVTVVPPLHRRLDDRRHLAWLTLGRRLGRVELSEEGLTDLRRNGEDFAGIDALRLRLALDRGDFAGARALARHALERIAVFGASERNGDLQSFSAWEAAALWGLGRHEEARMLLERVGLRDLGNLRGPRVEDFR